MRSYSEVLPSMSCCKRDHYGLYRRAKFPHVAGRTFYGHYIAFGENQDRLGVVIEFVAGKDGCVNSSNIYRAIVRNKAQLTYNAVGAWLEGTGAAPAKVTASADLQSQLELQDEAAQALKNQRYRMARSTLKPAKCIPSY